MADATDILTAVNAALLDAFPGADVRTSKRPAAGGRQLKGGFQFGSKLPCFVVSCSDPEPVDAVPTFELMSVGYAVVVEYCKKAQKVVASAARPGAPRVVDDPDVRGTREAIRNALYRTLAAVPGAFDTRHRSLPVYEGTADSEAVVLVSGEEFTVTTLVPRPGAS